MNSHTALGGGIRCDKRVAASRTKNEARFERPAVAGVCAQVAMTFPSAVAACNLDLEALISDANRTIATLAITTLLKTGNESSVERLLKQIGSFMSDIADDFKIVVVEAIRSLCLKFPQKCAPLAALARSCPEPSVFRVRIRVLFYPSLPDSESRCFNIVVVEAIRSLCLNFPQRCAAVACPRHVPGCLNPNFCNATATPLMPEDCHLQGRVLALRMLDPTVCTHSGIALLVIPSLRCE